MWSFRRYIHKIGRKLSTLLPCSNVLNASGNVGVYEVIINVGTATGLTGIIYDTSGVPDRFEIYYDDVKVIDTKFVGDNIVYPGNPTGGVVAGTYTLNNFEYNGTAFVATGTTTDVTIDSSSIANNTTEPTNGNGTVLFNKTTASPTTIRVVTTGSPTGGSTAWSFRGVCPRDPQTVIAGDEKLIYGFFNEANKANQSRSGKFILATTPSKFFTNRLGNTNFTDFGFTLGTTYMNDGTNWWEIDATGNIISTGLL